MHADSTPRTAALLPVKSPTRAKSRLAEELGVEETSKVAEALLEDPLSLVRSTPELEWWVISDDIGVLTRAEEAGALTLRDHGQGLNEAVGSALPEIIASGVDSILVIPCDVPLAW